MKLVIDIPDTMYNWLKTGFPDENDGKIAVKAILDGTPLPKGHGDLIDRKDLIENGISRGFCNWYDEIKMADTIIKADKAES